VSEQPRGLLSVAELAANAGLSETKMRRLLADFETAGIAERVGDDWRLTDAAAAHYCVPFDAIRGGNVPLEEGDDDGLSHCQPGPPANRARAA
jgi:IclR helix-turn-helix domain